MTHRPTPLAEIRAAFPDDTSRHIAMAGNVPPDVAAAARQLFDAIERHKHPTGGTPQCLYRIRRSVAKFLEFADLA